MPKTTRTMPSFEGVAAGATATLRLPIGLTYHQLLITYSDITMAEMEGIRLIANGRVIQDWNTGTELDTYNQFQGRAAANGVLVLDLERYGLRTIEGQALTALGTGHPDDPTPITTLSLEIDCAAAAAGVAMSCKAVQSAASPAGLIRIVKRFVYSPGASGEFEISDIPKKIGLVNQAFFNKSDITNLEIERDNFTVFDRTTAENSLMQSDGKRTPQSNWEVYDPTEDGLGAEGLAIHNTNDLRWKVTVGSSGSLPVVMDFIGTLGV